MRIILILIPLLFIAYLVYSNWSNPTDADLQALAALQSKYVTLDSGKLDSKEFEKQKLEIIASINKNLDSAKQDIAELQTTIAVITSLSADSNVFKKYMTESTNGIADANAKIVEMAKDIATKVNRVDLDQVRALLESKVSTTDISKLSSLIESIESKVNGALSKEEITKIVKEKADQSALENVAMAVNEISNKLALIPNYNSEIDIISENITDLSNLVKNNTESADLIKGNMSKQLITLQNAIASMGDVDDKNLATAMSQIAMIKAGLDNKADVTIISTMRAEIDSKADVKSLVDLQTAVNKELADNTILVTGMQSSIQKLLADVPELKTSIDIITKSLDQPTKSIEQSITYTPDEEIEFKTTDTIRFAMTVRSGVVKMGYSEYYKGINYKTITLEQLMYILRNYEGILGNSAKVAFISDRAIDALDANTVSFGKAENYLIALLFPESIPSSDRTLQKSKFPRYRLMGASANLDRGAGDPEWPIFFTRLVMKAIYAVIQLSSRMDCFMELRLEFKPTVDVKTISEKPSDVQIKVYKDKSVQSRIHFSAAIDASNGLTVPYPEYNVQNGSGPVLGESNVICPSNSYMCGLNGLANGGLYPVCCSFHPGMSFSKF